MRVRSIARKWWFWLAIIILIPVAWFVWGYVTWQLDRQDMLAENRSAYLGWLKMEAEQKMLETQYRADTYGGVTPEETLRLFVEALEKKDYELASKYFVPESQEESLEGFAQAEASGGMAGFIDAYRNGRVVPPGGIGSSGIYEFELYKPKTREYPYRIRLVESGFTGKWKIVEL